MPTVIAADAKVALEHDMETLRQIERTVHEEIAPAVVGLELLARAHHPPERLQQARGLLPLVPERGRHLLAMGVIGGVQPHAIARLLCAHARDNAARTARRRARINQSQQCVDRAQQRVHGPAPLVDDRRGQGEEGAVEQPGDVGGQQRGRHLAPAYATGPVS